MGSWATEAVGQAVLTFAASISSTLGLFGALGNGRFDSAWAYVACSSDGTDNRTFLYSLDRVAATSFFHR